MTTFSYPLISYLTLLAILVSNVVLASPCEKNATQLPSNIVLTPFIDGLQMPVHLTHAGDGSGRVYVVEQHGVIRVIENGKLRATPFLDISDRVKSGGEKGLLSVAFPEDFSVTGRLYVNYTAATGGLHTRVSRFTTNSADVADPKSETILLAIEQPFGNHNGGQLAFGPDGMLYIGMGDGGSANDPGRHGQNLGTLLGALLRIDVSKSTTQMPYAVPTDNPFIEQTKARGEIWAFGLRNPWRFSFDRRDGKLWLADVGQNAEEEINVVRKGGNYGWNIMEGYRCTPGVDSNCKKAGFDAPIWSYERKMGKSVTGGFVYRGNAIEGLCGVYVFGDFMSGKIWGLIEQGSRPVHVSELAVLDDGLSSFGEDELMNLYVLGYGSGRVYRVTAEK